VHKFKETASEVTVKNC